MQQGRSGMGPHKHGTSGHATKSPRMRVLEKVEAERSERKKRKTSTVMVSSIRELFHK